MCLSQKFGLGNWFDLQSWYCLFLSVTLGELSDSFPRECDIVNKELCDLFCSYKNFLLVDFLIVRQSLDSQC